MPTKLSESSFTENLIALRDHYQAILSEYESQAAQAREQLSHINALMGDSLLTTSEKRSLKTRAKGSTVDTTAPAESAPPPPTPTSKAKARSAKSPQRKPKSPPKAKAAKPLQKKTAAAKKTTSEKKNAKAPTKQPRSRKSPQQSKPAKPSVQLEVLPAYQGKGMTLAVETILRDHKGQAMTAETVLNELYGELDRVILPVAKKRLHDILSKGVKAKRWKRVPRRRGTYILR